MIVYQQVRGKPFSYKLIGFAERRRFKLASKAPQDTYDRWSQGVYIGRDRMTGQHILFDYEKMEVCKARTMLRVPNYQNKQCKLSVAKLHYSVTEFPGTPIICHVNVTSSRHDCRRSTSSTALLHIRHTLPLTTKTRAGDEWNFQPLPPPIVRPRGRILRHVLGSQDPMQQLAPDGSEASPGSTGGNRRRDVYAHSLHWSTSTPPIATTHHTTAIDGDVV